jgi:hypothetical protein
MGRGVGGQRHVPADFPHPEKRSSIELAGWTSGLTWRGSGISPHYLINGTIFVKKLLSMKYVFSFSVQILSKIFLIQREIKRDIIINVKSPSYRVPVIHARP